MVLLASYTLSMGPAFHYFGMKGLVPYAPIIVPAVLIPGAGKPTAWYLNLWATNGITVEIRQHDLVVSEPIGPPR
jgi:hypothetical protein